MKIHLLNDSKQGLGGGWTFLRNLKTSLEKYPDEVKFVSSIEESDICFVAGPTMVTRETIDKVQGLGKKLIVRLDNVPRNSRNRNTGTSRLKEFSERADGIIWQCKWAEWYLGDFIKPKKSTIIYNGVDTSIFKKDGAYVDLGGSRENTYLYSRFNRDETKNWEVAWYTYQLIQRENPTAQLVIVGNFSQEQMDYNFDFFRGERIKYLGVVEEPQKMANIMRSCGKYLATYFNDAFSNTYLESLACGMELHDPNMSGGTPEMIELFTQNGLDYFNLERMGKEYLAFFKEILG